MIFYDFTISKLNGDAFDLNQFKGKKIVVVNVASECGNTPQYAELEALHLAYEGKNVAFIGIPCNDFGAQEPGTAEEIQQFCSTNYGITFPLTEKVHAVGKAIHPLYEWLSAETNAEVRWNFQKFLIDETGHAVKSIHPNVTPNDPELVNWLNEN